MKKLMKAAMIMAMSAMVFTVSAQAVEESGKTRGPRQGQDQGEQLTPEQRIDRQVDQMTKEFQLTDKQKGEVKAVFEKQLKDREANAPKDGEKPTMEARKAQAEKMEKETNAEMKKILTPEQYKQYETKLAERKKQMEGRMQKRQNPRQDQGVAPVAAPAVQQ